jgi:Pvc16 N-terminal domain
MFTTLQATSLSLSQALQQRFTNDVKLRSFFNPVFGGTMVVSLNSPQEMTDLGTQGLSVWLYQVVRDNERLNMLPEKIGPTQYRHEPLPVRLHYMMTPLVSVQSASSPETEQMILGKVLQVFHDRPSLRGANLRGDLTGTDSELNVRLENLSIEQISQVFYSLDRSLQLSISYEVAIVYIESEREPEDAPPVQVAMPRYGIEVGGN